MSFSIALRQITPLLTLLLASAGARADAALTDLETRWIDAADPVLSYAEQQSLPIDIIVQPKSKPGDAPLAMGYDQGRCKLVFSFRGNPDAESVLEGVAADQVATTIEAMIAHEVAHCWRHKQGTWRSSPSGFMSAAPGLAVQEMQQTRLEEGFADLFALAWTFHRHPEQYTQIRAWFEQVREDQVVPGSHHDTRLWIDLARDPSPFRTSGTLFEQARAVWVAGLDDEK